MSTFPLSLPAGSDAHLDRYFEYAADLLPHVLWTARPDGVIDFLSSAYRGYTGLDPDIGAQSWLEALHPDDRERCLQVWQEAIETERDYAIDFRVFHHPSGEYRWHAVNAKPTRDEHGKILKWYGICVDIHESRMAKEEAQRRAAHLQSALEHVSDAFLMLDRQWRFLYLNNAAEDLLSVDCESLLGTAITGTYPEEEFSRFYKHCRRAFVENCAVHFEDYVTGLNKWFEYHAYPSDQGLLIYVRDISERKRAELELERTSRGLRILSRANAALTQFDNEDDLLCEICQIALEGGDYRAAWVGIAQDDDSKSIAVRAWSGDEAVRHYIEALSLSWSEETPLGRGPSGKTIREGRPVVFTDTLNDPEFGPWRSAAKKSQYLSGVCLPLRSKKRNMGVLVLVNYGKRIISDDEILLLQELAENLSFGLVHARAQKMRRHVESAVVKVAASISRASGNEFFQKLAGSMAEAMGAEGVFLSRLIPEADPPEARILAGEVDGQRVENIRYLLHGRPCKTVLEQGSCIIETGVWEVYPGMAEVVPKDMRSFAGQRLDDANGQALGVLFMVSRKKIEYPELISSMLQIFAARAAAELERLEKETHIHYQASLLDKARDAIVVRDLEGRILFWNKGAEHLYGWNREEAVGRNDAELFSESPFVLKRIVDQVLSEGSWDGEQVKRHRNGSSVIVEGRWTLFSDDQGQPQSIFSIHTDISSRKAAEHEIQRLAFFDQLTGLPNRQRLRDRLLRALQGSAHSKNHGALMFLDLDHFKELNDIYGHARGDLLLKCVAQRLTQNVSSSDTVARLGGDEFVLVVEDLSTDPMQASKQAEGIAERIRTALNQPFEMEGTLHVSTPSIGVVLFDGSTGDIDELLKCADLAMYKAKSAGRNAIRFYDPDMQAAVIARAALEADLRESVEKDLFTLVYQPQVDSDYHIIGVEALVRWQHPQRLNVPPSVFIPVAEDTHLIIELGRLVLKRACMQLRQWEQHPHASKLNLAVNISARQFHHLTFVHDVISITKEYGINPDRLKLELTESILVEDMAEAASKMTELQKHGIAFSLDDFGTGYSSLSYLHRLPIEQLKIDRSFIAEVPGNGNDISIVEAIIALGRKLGLHVIAEGVETEEQRNFLCHLGCHAYQGYLIAKPMSSQDFNAFLEYGVTLNGCRIKSY